MGTMRLQGISLAQVVGEELSPGVKKGGYLNLIQRRVNCVGPASAIPKELELDVSSLDFGPRINLSGLNLPAEVSIAGVVGDSCSISKLPYPRACCASLHLFWDHLWDHCTSCGQCQQEFSLPVQGSDFCAGDRASHMQIGRKSQSGLMFSILHERMSKSLLNRRRMDEFMVHIRCIIQQNAKRVPWPAVILLAASGPYNCVVIGTYALTEQGH